MSKLSDHEQNRIAQTVEAIDFHLNYALDFNDKEVLTQIITDLVKELAK